MSEASTPIRYFNQKTQTWEQEQVYGEDALRFLYETRLGRWLTNTILSHPVFSKLYGSTQDLSLSARKIETFISKFNIDMTQYEAGPFNSFNDFFIRKFKPGLRSYPVDSNKLGAFAEARYLAFSQLNPSQRFPVKTVALTASELLNSTSEAKPFENGPAVIARLCPVDYHRYHYPDGGKTLKAYSIHGPLHSVSPIALKQRPEILLKNERRVSILETQNFGKLAYVEIGALNVGKICQTASEDHTFERGQEKGYFLFGGSCVVVLGEPGKWHPHADIVSRTLEGFETWLPLGHELGAKS